jgi:hypothetical protein
MNSREEFKKRCMTLSLPSSSGIIGISKFIYLFLVKRNYAKRLEGVVNYDPNYNNNKLA